MERNELIETVVVVIYKLVIIAGCAYLVQVHNWSPWWFVLALLIMAGSNKPDRKEAE